MRKELLLKHIETKEKEPKISYHILYGPHRTAKDFEKLEQAFEGADIYIPELAKWKPKNLKEYNKLSQGKITPTKLARRYSIDPDSSLFEEYKIIYNSKKPILLIDVPKGHEILKERKKKGASKSYAHAFRSFMDGKFQSAFQSMRQYVEIIGDYYSKREEVIRTNLKEKVGEAIKGHSEFGKKEEVKVLLKLGVSHTPVYHHLKKEKLPISWEFAYMPTIFPALTEAHRRFGLTKNKEISDELLARVFVERLIVEHLMDITDDSNKMRVVQRKISSKLNLQEIAEISKEFGKNKEITIINCLRKRNIEIPKTEEEMDKMIEK